MASLNRMRRENNLVSLASRRPLATSGTRNVIVSSTGNPSKPAQVTFDRSELNAILRVYSFMVAGGEWKDYAIDQLRDRAVFSIYRRATEVPLFRIEKEPARTRKQGAYAVYAQSGTLLKRGHDIAQVMKVFDRQLKLVD